MKKVFSLSAIVSLVQKQHLVTILIVLCCLMTVGQTAEEHLKKGIAKHNQQDFKGAISEYDHVIKADKNNAQAYYNRGTCELALGDYTAAMKDFSKTIELDPQFVKAYYGRASVYVSQEQYAQALPDLDRSIGLDPGALNALTLRGQIRAQTGNKNGACEDFNKAKELGDKQADKYISQFCGNAQLAGESLLLYWPEAENWKVGRSQENAQMGMIELIRGNETLENWTELGTMMSVKGVRNVAMDQAMNMMFDQARENSPEAKLTLIEKDEKAEYPWIIFSIESPYFKNDKRPESQLWYIVQGKTSLYTNFRALKQAVLPAEKTSEWVAFFKTGKIVYK